MKNLTVVTVEEWTKNSRKIFNILKSIPMSRLKTLGSFAGLDMTHYTNKPVLIKGLMIRLSSFPLPDEVSNWK